MENETESTLARKRSRITAIALGASVIICLLFLIYAVIQKAQADIQRQIAKQLQIEVELLRKDAQECRKIVEQQLLRSEQMLRDAVQSSQSEKEEAAKERK